jgi:hypothetical protein
MTDLDIVPSPQAILFVTVWKQDSLLLHHPLFQCSHSLHLSSRQKDSKAVLATLPEATAALDQFCQSFDLARWLEHVSSSL